jgi:hypothetical protein
VLGVDTYEVMLRTLVFQFDGRVMEIFGGANNDAIRHHVAQMKEPHIEGPNRKGRSLVKIGSNAFYIDADEMAQLEPFLETVTEAIRAARAAFPKTL